MKARMLIAGAAGYSHKLTTRATKDHRLLPTPTVRCTGEPGAFTGSRGFEHREDCPREDLEV